MRRSTVTAALFSGAILVVATSAAAQVETTAVTEESRQEETSKPEPPLPPRKNPTVYGVGIASTVTGALAIPIGAGIVFVKTLHTTECIGGGCQSSDLTGTVGLVVIGAGMILLAVGIPMIVVGGKRVSKDTAAFDPLTIRF